MTRAERRKDEAKKQKKRLKDVADKGYPVDDPRRKGHYKHNHIGCGCPMCKPHKHGFADPMKPSLRRKDQDEDDLVD